MKRALMVVGLVVTMMAETGCVARNRACNDCNGPLGCRPCQMGWQRGGSSYGHLLSRSNFRRGGDAEQAGPGGPAMAQAAYPYYTNRGPRDFLLNNPPTIGR